MRVTVNVALLRPAAQVTTWQDPGPNGLRYVAGRAVDNDVSTSACTHDIKPNPWWSVDLGREMDVGRVCVVNDGHGNGLCFYQRLA